MTVTHFKCDAPVRHHLSPGSTKWPKCSNGTLYSYISFSDICNFDAFVPFSDCQPTHFLSDKFVQAINR